MTSGTALSLATVGANGGNGALLITYNGIAAPTNSLTVAPTSRPTSMQPTRAPITPIPVNNAAVIKFSCTGSFQVFNDTDRVDSMDNTFDFAIYQVWTVPSAVTYIEVNLSGDSGGSDAFWSPTQIGALGVYFLPS